MVNYQITARPISGHAKIHYLPWRAIVLIRSVLLYNLTHGINWGRKDWEHLLVCAPTHYPKLLRHLVYNFPISHDFHDTGLARDLCPSQNCSLCEYGEIYDRIRLFIDHHQASWQLDGSRFDWWVAAAIRSAGRQGIGDKHHGWDLS